MIDPSSRPAQSGGEWVDMRSIRSLVDRAVRHPRSEPAEGWPDGADAFLGRHWRLADHDWHRRRTRTVGGQDVEELDDHETRFALLPDGRLIRADRTRSTGEPWRTQVRALTPRDVRALDLRPVESSVEHGGSVTWGTQPSGEPVAKWPGAGLELLLKGLIA